MRHRLLDTRRLGFLVLAGLVNWPSPAARAAESPAPDWVRVTEHAPFSERDTAEGVVFADKLWLSNGYVSGAKLVQDLWCSSDGIRWELVTTNTPYDGYAEMTVYNNTLWAVAGNSWPLMNDVWRLVPPLQQAGRQIKN
jgi:hypothetical protein